MYHMPVITDKNTVLPLPSMPRPARGVAVTDPTFGTQIMRVTDETTSPSGSGVSYSYWCPGNVNNTRIWDYRTSKVYGFDPVNFALTGETIDVSDIILASSNFAEDAYWSRTNPDVLFYRQNTSINKVNVVTKQVTVVANLTTLKSSLGTNLLRPWQLHVSDDDNRISFTWLLNGVVNGSNKAHPCVWDVSQNAVIFSKSMTGVDECQISKGGNHLVVKLSNKGAGKVENIFYNLTDGTSVNVYDDLDKGLGHSDNGFLGGYGYENWTDTIVAHKFDNPKPYQTLFDFNDLWAETHFSARASLGGADTFAVISTMGMPTNSRLSNEVFAIALDGSQRIWRFLQHRTAGTTYNQVPMGSLSKDGKFLFFTSNWGTTRGDLYVARVPDEILNAFGTTPPPDPDPEPEPEPPTAPCGIEVIIDPTIQNPKCKTATQTTFDKKLTNLKNLLTFFGLKVK